MKGGAYVLIVIIVVMAGCLVIAAGYPYLQAKIAPMLVGGVVLVLSGFELVKELRTNKGNVVSIEEAPKVEGEKARSYQKEAAWMIGFFFVLYLVGFIIGIAGFTAVYAKAHKTRWPTAVILGIFMAGLSWFLFSYLVQSELYPGIIPEYLGLAG